MEEMWASSLRKMLQERLPWVERWEIARVVGNMCRIRAHAQGKAVERRHHIMLAQDRPEMMARMIAHAVQKEFARAERAYKTRRAAKEGLIGREIVDLDLDHNGEVLALLLDDGSRVVWGGHGEPHLVREAGGG